MDRGSVKQTELGLENESYYAIAVSDLHLGYDKADKEAFKVFLLSMLDIRVNHLLLVGDILDMWRRDNKNLIKDNEDILKMLQNLRNNGNVGTIHYVIGNHDFSIQLMEKEFPILTELFTFHTGSSSERVWAGLPLDSEDKQFSGKSFKFMHGHQLSAGAGDHIFPLYDGVCATFCKQGDFLGRVASAIWDLRYTIPIILGVSTLLALVLQAVNWSIVFGICTIISMIVIYGIGIRRKAKKGLTFNDQVHLLIEALPLRTKRKIMRYIKAPPKQRGVFEEVSDRDIDKAYSSVEDRIVDIDRDTAHDIINEAVKTLPTDKGFNTFLDALGPNEHQVIGHTHEADPGVDLTNLGCWEKGHTYYYLVIHNDGKHELKEWLWAEISRWQRLKRRIRRQSVPPGYSRVSQIAQIAMQDA